MKKIIAVFGSSIPKPGDKEYELAYQLGKSLAENGFDVCSGGFQGIMEAVSKGAVEKNAEAIGVTVDNNWGVAPNKFITKEIRTKILFERISKIVELSSGFVVLNGGTGTLLELSVVWEYLNKSVMKPKPVVSLGEMWRELIRDVDERMVFENRNSGLIKQAKDVKDCIEILVKELRF